jgi:hypothetical protein
MRAGNAFTSRSWLLVLLLAALHLLPFWMVEYIPTQDGPAHLYNAELLRVFDAPQSTTLRRYFEPREGILSNRLAHLTLARLMDVTTPRVAEKVFISVYLTMFVAGALYAVRTVNREHAALACLLLPLMVGYPLQMGFYAFCASVVGYLFAVGYWLRHRTHFRGRDALVLALLLVLTFLWHPFSVVTAVIVLAVGFAASVALRWWYAGRTAYVRIGRELGLGLVALVPPLLMFAGFRDESEAVPITQLIPGPGRIVRQLTRVPDWVSYTSLELVPAFVLLCATALCAGVILWRKVRTRALEETDALVIAAAVYAGLYFVVPDAAAGGGYVHVRLVLYASLALVLWLAAQALVVWQRRLLLGVGVLANVSLVALYTSVYAGQDRFLTEYASALAHIPPHSAVLALSAADRGILPNTPGDASRRVRPLHHAGGRVGAGSDVALLTNYQGDKPHFPVKFRADLNPYDIAGDFDLFPFSRIRLGAFEQATGKPIDVIVLWGPMDARWVSQPEIAELMAEIRGRYELVFVSSPLGMARVWHRRERRAMPAGS